MEVLDISLFALFAFTALVFGFFLGNYVYKIYDGKKTFLDPLMTPIENALFRISGINTEKSQSFKEYTLSLMVFNLFGIFILFFILFFQSGMGLNPQNFTNLSWHLALNTAISFVTNTNWQSYGGESTMSYFSQMAGLSVQNFLSAATGVAVAVALMRGLSGREIGNFYVDITKTTLRILLPIAFVYAIFLMSQGVIQTFSSYVELTTIEGAKQTLAMGPVASQESIKMLGTNGGGFFNVNSAHPFENPNEITNFIQIFSIFLIPIALLFAYGKFTGNRREGVAVFGAMALLFALTLGTTYYAESQGNAMLTQLGVEEGPSMEGKEVRFALGASSLFATVTTAASCGAVNSMHDSYSPLAGGVLMLQMMIGEVIFGGVGAGFYGMMIYVLLSMFMIGLMVGKTPMYLGKKIEAYEIKAVIIALLLPSAAILGFSAIAANCADGLAGLNNAGPHGLGEILYAYSSAAGNNGSAFAGLTANTPFYNMTLAIAMLIGRFGVIIPMIAIAASMANKKTYALSSGAVRSDTITFTIFLAFTVLILGALTFLPALTFTAIAEHVLMLSGKLF
ncbi:potassium-transporting ATPase subunit KdpA [Sulfuricurvum sp.]|uniref:potassium-transporting ATPase subunit KdpA n=1 Tax=Sulfuricurvum sp. TaxID=2025608 RepID=UPI00260A8A0A|nr:potassium-transporting ATPase subunit KdpA [Sulfuricurvum sp.]MDD3595788.1 potassium-transporting ATPase subunit KdpA [Sulfuricurvum sp.]